MVFWMSIAFVPLFATEGRYLDLIRDKTVAALIKGCVAAVVALTVTPIRSSREVRPAVLAYLDALDKALLSHLPDEQDRSAAADAVHGAYLRLTPLLSDYSRRLHGWTDDRIATGIDRLRDAVEAAKAAAQGEAAPVTGYGPVDDPHANADAGAMTLELADSLWRVEQLHARLIDLALFLDDRPAMSAHWRAGMRQIRPRLLRRG
jgi:hypothetical protein